MPKRDEALLRMLESHPAAESMTSEERRELCDHLCDAVDAKVRAGRTELQATAEAFAELGNLRKIAVSFRGGPMVTTPEGVLVAISGWTAPLAAYLLLAGLWYVSVIVAPGAIRAASASNLDLPGIVQVFLAVTSQGARGALLLAAFPLVAMLFLRRFGARRVFQATCGIVAVVALLLVLGGVVTSAIVGSMDVRGG